MLISSHLQGVEDEMILTSRKLGANKILSSEVFNKKYQKMEQPRSFDLFYKGSLCHAACQVISLIK